MIYSMAASGTAFQYNWGQLTAAAMSGQPITFNATAGIGCSGNFVTIVDVGQYNYQQ